MKKKIVIKVRIKKIIVAVVAMKKQEKGYIL